MAWRRHPTAWLWLVLLAALGGGCRTAVSHRVSDPAPAVARLQGGGSIRGETDSLVKPLLASGEAYGMVVGVITPDGATQCFGYGRTGRANDPNPPDGNSIFQIGSLSKLFAESLFVQAELDGRLHDDDTVRAILPTNVPVSPDAGRLTLYQLATHTGGLRREPFTARQMWSFFDYMATGHDLYSHLTVPYCLAYLRDCHPRPKNPPEYFYSNFGAALLTYLMREKLGCPVEDLIVTNICLPLGMTNSVFVLNTSQQQRLVVGHVGNQACWKPAHAPLKPWEMGDFMRPISGMYSTADDLLVFAKANLGMVPSPLAPAFAATHQARIKTADGAEALGWKITKYDQDRRMFTYKIGLLSGYSAFIGLDLDNHIAVVVLANQFDWDEKVGMNLLLRISEFYTPPPRKTAN